MHSAEIIKHADLAQFKSPRSPLMFGRFLEDVKIIQRSITHYGLMEPLIVTREGNVLHIMDGKKRFAALKRLSFQDNLPRSLVTIPYILIEDIKKLPRRGHTMMSDYDSYQAVKALRASGQTIDEICKALYLCRKSVLDFIQLSHLAPSLLRAFFKNILSFDQVRAYATLPHEADQIAALKHLGPFANEETILNAIKTRGWMRVETPFSLATSNVVTLNASLQNATHLPEHPVKQAA